MTPCCLEHHQPDQVVRQREHVQFLRRYLTEPAGRLADGAPVARRLPGEVGRDAGHRRDRDAPPRGAVRRIGREIVRHADVKDAEVVDAEYAETK